MQIIPRLIKLKKEGFRHYSFKFKGKQYSVQYVVGDKATAIPTYYKGWQVYWNPFPINVRLNKTRRGALDTFLFHNQ